MHVHFTPSILSFILQLDYLLHNICYQILFRIIFTVFNIEAELYSKPQTSPELSNKLVKLMFLSFPQLTPNVIMGLHQMVQAIQQYDYATGLAYHTQMVSQGNFSEISSFMPGIKVLMQTATQLGVYVQ